MLYYQYMEDILGNIILSVFFLSNIYFLYDKSKLFIVFLFGFFINEILNLLLKGIIQQPRPTENYRLFNLELLNIKRSKSKEPLISYDRYGMPSGHAQFALYSTIYIYLALKNTTVTTCYILLSLSTLYQRVVFGYHTISQVIVGAIIGLSVGYVAFLVGSRPSHSNGL